MTVPQNDTTPNDDLTNNDLAISTPQATKMAVWFISSFGLTANAFVIFVVTNYAPMRKTLTNTFIVNQSTIDGLAALFILLTTAFEDSQTAVHVHGNLNDELTCRLWFTKFPLWALLLTSTYGIVAMSLEKYLAVVHALWYVSRFSRSRAMVWTLLAAPWINGCGFLAGYSITTSGITPAGLCTTYSAYPNRNTQRVVGFLIFTVQYFLPFAVLVYLYSLMASGLHKRVLPSATNGDASESGMSSDMGATPWRNVTMMRARTNVIKTLATVSAFFVLCWSANQIYYVLYNLGFVSIDFRSTFYALTVLLVFVNCCVNPVIYALRYRLFQKGVLHIFHRRARGGVVRPPQTATMQSVNNSNNLINVENRAASDETVVRREAETKGTTVTRARTCF